MKRALLPFGLFLSAFSLFSCLKSVDRKTVPNDDFAAVRSFILSQIERNVIPSAAVAVARDGKVIWQEAFGWADREKNIRATPDTMYGLRSISKTMTATGLMTLVDGGDLGVDDTLDRFLSPSDVSFAGFDGSLNRITLRNLLNHASGLPQHFYYYYRDEPEAPPSSAETIRRYAVFVEPPGSSFAYSNLGYEIIKKAIEKTSGEDFASFMKTRIFEKLGMNRTFINGWDNNRYDGVAVPYDDKGRPLPPSVSDTPAAGDGYSSVGDLIAFGMFHLGDRQPFRNPVFGERLIGLMQSAGDPRAVNPARPAESYGWGWFFNETDYNRKTVWHEGGSIGSSALLKLIPSEDLGIAVLINTFDSGVCNRIADDILKICLPDFKKINVPVKAAMAGPQRDIRPRGAWTGTLKTIEKDIPLTMIFQPDGDVIIESVAQFETKWVFPGSPEPFPQRLVFNVIRLTEHWIFGWCLAVIPDAEAKRYPHVVMLSLNRTPRRMSGTAMAVDRTPRQHFGISYFVSLAEKK